MNENTPTHNRLKVLKENLHVVDPPDFEQIVIQQRTHEGGRCLPFVDFPADDVSVELQRRECRTVSPAVPFHSGETDQRVKECIEHYTNDYKFYRRRYLNYSSSQNSKEKTNEVSDHQKSLNKQNYEIDVIEELTPLQRADNKRSSIRLTDTSRSWASNAFDLKNSQPDTLLDDLLDHVPFDEVDAINLEQRSSGRHNQLFSVFPMQDEDEVIEKRDVPQAPTEHFGHRVLVQCHQLKLEPECEPLFAIMALYDAKERKRLSENFYFDMTSKDTKKLLASHIPSQDISTLSRSCIFSITNPSPDIFIVIRLEKVLQPGDVADLYLKDDKHQKEKYSTLAAQYCEKLGAYRMPFAFTAIHLMNVVNGANSLDYKDSTLGSDNSSSGSTGSLERRLSGVSEKFINKRKDEPLTRSVSGVSMDNRASLKSNGSIGTAGSEKPLDKRASWCDSDVPIANLDTFRPVTLTVASFFKQETDRLNDEDFYKLLLDIKRSSGNLKKLKSVPCTVKLDICPCPDEHKYCLSPELSKIHPYPDEKGRPTKEIIEFPLRPLYVPHTTYRNLLYVYPKYVNFSNKPGSARNIAVKVQVVRGGDSDPQYLPAIFGKSSCPEFTDAAFTAVSYHNKTPDFYDEIKVKLPAKLTQAHYLFFTFSHISCQLQKKEGTHQTETPIGYSWIPLMRDGSLHLGDRGDFTLPICTEKPPPHFVMMMPDVSLPGLKWLDSKGLFCVSLQAVSSVHTQDRKLDYFLRNCHAVEEKKIPSHIGEARMEKELKSCILDVPNAETEPLVQFLPLVMDELIKLVVKPPIISNQTVNVTPTVFEAMASIVCGVSARLPQRNDVHCRNVLLTQYIHYCASIPPGDAMSGRPSSVPDFSMYHRPGSVSTPGGLTSRPVSMMKPTDSVRSFHSQYSPSGSLNSPSSNESLNHSGRSSGSRKHLHEELALQWVVSSNPVKEKAMEQAWFFFELMVKCMAEHLSTTGLINAPRKQRFPTQFTDDCTALVVMITKEIVEKFEAKPTYVKQLNTSLAFFIFDIISLMDRGYVFTLTKHYCNTLADKVSSCKHDASSLVAHKLDFMRIVSSHEHYLTLNLPFTTLVANPADSMSSIVPQQYYATTELTDEFRQQHFFVGIILCDLVAALATHNPLLQKRAVGVVTNLLYCHDLDPRFNQKPFRAKIAQLYLPLVSITCDILFELWDPSNIKLGRKEASAIDLSAISRSSIIRQGELPPKQASSSKLDYETTRSLLISCIWVLKNMDQETLTTLWSDVGSSRLGQIVDLLYLSLANFEYKAKWIPKITMRENPKRSKPVSRKFSFHEDMLKSSNSMVLNGSEPEKPKSSTIGPSAGARLLRSSSFTNMAKEEFANATSTLSKKLKYVSAQTIKKSTDMKTKLEDVILGSGSARTDFLSRRKQSSNSNLLTPTTAVTPGSASPQPDVKLRWRKDQTQWRQDMTTSFVGGDKIKFVEPDFLVLGHLASEVCMVTLDMLEIIIKVIGEKGGSLQHLLTGVTRSLLHCLAINQSSYVLRHAFASQRSLVTKYPELLFEDNTEACADLCLHLLSHCSSSLGDTRSHAAASLYMLMRQNFELGNNFARVKMQVTMSLSNLVGQNQFYNEEYLRASLKTILTYAEHDVELQQTTFTDQVRDLVFNLHMILSDTVKMKEFQEDPEMLLDLMYRIAKGYQTSPDLRLTWLQNMAAKHIENDNYAEAAECYVHCAGLVVEYMNMIEEKTYLPIGCVDFQRVSANVLEESAVSDDVVSPDEEGICTGKHFTDIGLIQLLEQAADSFYKAGVYEMVNEVYKLLAPVYEYQRDFEKLLDIHARLQMAFKYIILNEGKRMFGTYFRVGFYGAKFGDLNGQEYIYKEPSITKLSEIAHRLENFYGDRFGHENVSIIKDSNTVEQDKLAPGKAFMQITYVEQYFDQYELEQRKTYFEKNHNLSRFMYATPFTLDGRAHGDLGEQYKRKTILTTSQSFPYVKTRIAVISKEQVILEPIQVAIEDIQKKIKELNGALFQTPLDPKILQMVLQGCIGTTVNQGPVEVASVFLGEVAEGKATPTRHHNKLRVCFKDFLNRCGQAIKKNAKLIQEDQHEYQRELERNYTLVNQRISSLVQPHSEQPYSPINGSQKKHSQKPKSNHISKRGASLYQASCDYNNSGCVKKREFHRISSTNPTRV